jgi:hypothetical protein
VSDDEFDDPKRAPTPAYERQWRHPAELADAQRTSHLTASPPLSRRLTALTATVSVIASVAVLGVAIPKGISTYREEAAESPTTSSPFSRIKNSSIDIMASAISGKGETSAISIGRGYWIVAAEAIDPQSPLWISQSRDEDLPARIVSTDADAGVVVLKTDDESRLQQMPDLSRVIEPTSITNFSDHRVVDANASQILVPSASLSTHAESKDVPITTEDAIHGIALIVDSSYRTIGIVVRRGHALWILQKSTVTGLLRTASGS